ncbi:hypothetical protein D3C73_800870 [compost metagenome]
MGFIPVYLRLKIDPAVSGIQDQILRNQRPAQFPAEPEHILHFAGMQHIFLDQLSFTRRLLLIPAVNIPGIPQGRTVVEKMKPVGAPALLHDLPACRFIEQADDFPLFIKDQPVMRSLPAVIQHLPFPDCAAVLRNLRYCFS